MLRKVQDINATRDALLSLLPTSGTLAGIAVTLVSLINIRSSGKTSTIADDILAFSALGFLISCYLIYFAVGHLDRPYATAVVRLIDGIFLLSLTLVVLSGFILVYEFI